MSTCTGCRRRSEQVSVLRGVDALRTGRQIGEWGSAAVRNALRTHLLVAGIMRKSPINASALKVTFCVQHYKAPRTKPVLPEPEKIIHDVGPEWVEAMILVVFPLGAGTDLHLTSFLAPLREHRGE